MNQPTIVLPLVELMAEHQGDSDGELSELMDAFADTLGDMLGFQSDRHALVARFVTRLQAAADAAGAEQVMSRN